MRSQQQQQDDDDDAMDWSPTASPVRPSSGAPPVPSHARQAQTNNVAVGDVTTGLETLLERTNIDSSETGGGVGHGPGVGRRQRGGSTQTRWSWGWVYALSLVPLIGVVYYHVLGGEFFALL